MYAERISWYLCTLESGDKNLTNETTGVTFAKPLNIGPCFRSVASDRNENNKQQTCWKWSKMWLVNYPLALKIQTLSRMTGILPGLDVINLVRPWKKKDKKKDWIWPNTFVNAGTRECWIWNAGIKIRELHRYICILSQWLKMINRFCWTNVFFVFVFFFCCVALK